MEPRNERRGVTRLGEHGQAKYATGARLGISHGRDWNGPLAERWRHSAGDLGEVKVSNTEVMAMLRRRLRVRQQGGSLLQHCDAVAGTVWLYPGGVREDIIRLCGNVREILHLFLPALQLSEPATREIDMGPYRVGLQYRGGFQAPLIHQTARAIRSEISAQHRAESCSSTA